ncbi:DUF6603 domain-containing protein [Kitasatospora sp. NPDC048286]|uniref:DUF6603 domain-containing protein n=1 Tax=Kitasatospora sp. NPDC048286 TaxID=3364047 RepID=UPI003712D088
MALPVDDLRKRLEAASGGTFKLGRTDLGWLDGEGQAFVHLPGETLCVEQADVDIAQLSARGRIALDGETSYDVAVRFRADEAGATVAGLCATVDVGGWQIRTAACPVDLGGLGECGFTGPELLLVAGPRGSEIADVAGDGAWISCRLPVERAGLTGSGEPLRFTAALGADGSLGPAGTADSSGADLESLSSVLGLKDLRLPGPVTPELKGLRMVYRPNGKSVVAAARLGLTDTRHVDAVVVSSMVEGRRHWAVLARTDLDLDLSGLPLVGDRIPVDLLAVTGVQLCALSFGLAPQEIEKINDLIDGLRADPPFPKLPTPEDDILPQGLLAVLEYKLGGGTRPALSVQLGGRQGGSTRPAPGGAPRSGGGAGLAGPWSALAESVGSLKLSGIGISAAEGGIEVRIDAELGLETGSFELIGAGFVISWDGSFSVRPTLDGAAFSYDQPPDRISGALEWAPESGYDTMLKGMLVAELPVINLELAAEYARKGSWVSVFAFAELDVPDGEAVFGPPPFTVTGLRLGGGYHSDLRVPDFAKVAGFPLVAGLADPDVISPPTAGRALEVLTGGSDPWVKPRDDHHWIAVGVRFTSFKFIEAQALAVVEFGSQGLDSLVLLGLVSVTFPRNRDRDAPLYARVGVQLEAGYKASEGLLFLAAALTGDSFIVDPACKLTGGLALYTWLPDSAHEGDFVLTVGGYHPYFQRPDHYPQVPRVGYSWSISDLVTAKGEGYVALTHSAFMVGAALSIVYHSGPLRAWLTAHFDALIQWAPFSFDIDLGISIGVSLTIDVWFVHATLSIEVGVDLGLWGPPVGGSATVHVWFVSFTFGFGHDRATPPPVPWTTFQSQLPAPIQLKPTAGLQSGPAPEAGAAHALAARSEDKAPWLVSCLGFSFATESAVPFSHLYLGSGQDACASGEPVDIRPMALTGVTSSQRVTLATADGQEVDLVASKWGITPTRRPVHRSLWGEPLPDGHGSDPNETLLGDRLTGMVITVPEPAAGSTPGRLTSRTLDTEPLVDAPWPLTDATPVGPVPRQSADSIAAVATGIASAATTTQRDALFAALAGLGTTPPGNDRLDAYAALAADAFTAAPLIIPAGTGR